MRFDPGEEANFGLYDRMHQLLKRDRLRESNDLSSATSAFTASGTGYKYETNTPVGVWQRTIDYNNSLFYRRAKALGAEGMFLRDIGSPFWTERFEAEPSVLQEGSVSKQGRTLALSGHPSTSAAMRNLLITFKNDGVVKHNLPVVTKNQLAGYGSTAIARTMPGAPEMNLGVAVGELRQLPSVPLRQILDKRDLSSLGSEYLNIAFGILPMIRDVQDVLRLTRTYESILKQFKRDHGRLIRRRITLVDDSDEQTSKGFWNGMPVDPYWRFYGNRKTTISTKVWFSGAYKTTYPVAYNGLLDGIIDFNKVYGALPSADLVWNLLPWSWLVDWFSNAGDVLRNVSYLGINQQLAYGYVMCQTGVTETEEGVCRPAVFPLNPADGALPLTQTYHHTLKRRIRATPFGFSLSPAHLTGKQGAILSALGLSRLRV